MSETIINLTAGNLGSAVVNVTTGKGSTKYDVDFGREFRTSYNINFGDRGPQGEQGIQGIAGPNEITTATGTNLTGYIYGDGTNIDGATRGVDFSSNISDMYGTIAIRNKEEGSLLANQYRFFFGSIASVDDAPTIQTSATSYQFWNFPDTSGYVAITTNATGSAANVEIYAKATTTIPRGGIVYISGASGANKLISLAQANTEPLSSKTIGVSIQALATNGFGYVMTEGDLTGLGINLGSGHGVEEGDPIWLSPTTAGGMVFGVANKPSAPDHMVFIGYVLRINGNTLDEIYVKIQNGYALEELHNVAISSPANKQVLAFDSATGLWKNQNASISGNTTSDLNGLIYSDGETLSAIEAETYATPDSQGIPRMQDGGIYLTKLRFTDGTYKYSQINPPAFNDGDTQFSLTLPRSSGTIATNNTALMLSGAQTANGAKTFNGQIELAGQSATNATSALTRQLGDERYGTFSAIRETTLSSTTTNFAQVVSITLPIGKYQIDAFVASLHVASAGCRIRFATNQPIKVGITDNYGRPASPAFSWPIIDDAYTNTSPYAIRFDTGAVEYRRTITGIIEILTSNTTLSLDYAQQVATPASPSEARKRSHILARKIN